MDMTIRWRTDVPINQRAGAIAVVGLAGATAIHALWANGSPWPAASFDELADTVVGRRPFPGRGATWTVTALLAAATMTVSARSGLVPSPGGPDTLLVRASSRAVAVTLLARGAVGAAVSAFGVDDSTAAFRRWNLAVYSPLSLALGAATAIASRSRTPTT